MIKEIDLIKTVEEQCFSKAKTLVLIGAMDGISYDEFYPFIMKWGHNLTKAVFVEPIPWWFEKLKDTYKEFNHFEFENSAISIQNGTQKMVAINPEKHDVPHWLYGCSMFGEKFTNLINDVKDEEVEQFKDYLNVNTITFNDLIAKYQIESIDLLKIDAEGQDWNILKQVDLNKYTPHIIVYEAFHLSPEDRESATKHCLDANYEVLLNGNVMIWKKVI